LPAVVAVGKKFSCDNVFYAQQSRPAGCSYFHNLAAIGEVYFTAAAAHFLVSRMADDFSFQAVSFHFWL
jgi:hypothetical protein